MKRRTTINQLRAWLCLVLALSAWSTASADIWVGMSKISGTEDVAAENFPNSGWIKSGKVSYTASSGTLTLDNATIDMSQSKPVIGNANMNIPISCTDSQLKVIKIVGNCTVKGKGSLAISSIGNLSIQGDSYETSTLTVESADGIFASGGLTLKSVTAHVSVTSNIWNSYPLRVSPVSGKGTLDFDNAIVTLTRPAEVEDPGRISDGQPRAIGNAATTEISRKGCDFLDAVWDGFGSDVYRVVGGKATTTPAYTVTIGRWDDGPFVNSNLRATPDNFSKITGDGIKGKVSWNQATHTLTLENAQIPSLFFTSGTDVCNLELIGTNVIKRTTQSLSDCVVEFYGPQLNVRKSKKATGYPVLKISNYGGSTAFHSILNSGRLEESTITFTGIDLELQNHTAFVSNYLDRQTAANVITVDIENCNVTWGKCKSKHYFGAIKSLNLTACDFEGGKWDATAKTYSAEDFIIKRQPYTPIRVNGSPMRNGDKLDYSSSSGNSQYVEYKDNVLTLFNMQNNPIGSIEYFGTSDLTIHIFDLMTYNLQKTQVINSITSLYANVAIKNELPFAKEGVAATVVDAYGTDFPNLRLNIGTDPAANSVMMGGDKTLRIIDFTTQLTFVGSVGVGSIDIQNSNVDFTAQFSPVKGVNSVTTSGCALKTTGAELKGGYFYGSDGNRLASVSYGHVDGYPIWVNGVGITSDNKDNVTGRGIEGKVSYDPATHTLTLENARITDENAYRNGCIFVHHSIDDLKIELKGTNTLTCSNSTGILWYAASKSKELTITGNGTLNISAGGRDPYGIMIYGSHVPDKDKEFHGTVNIKGGAKVDVTAPTGIQFYGLTGTSQVNVNDAMFHVAKLDDDVFPIDGDYILTTNCDVLEPNVSIKDGQIVGDTDEFTLTRFYGISVGGVQVHPGNASMVMGENIKGYVSYDDSTHTLTLNNATITGAIQDGAKQGIVVDFDLFRLKIKLVGTNYITSGDAANTNQGNGIYSTRLLALEGTGSLTVDNFQKGIVVNTWNLDEKTLGQYMTYTPLTVTDCSLFLNTPEGIERITTVSDNLSKIRFTNAYVEARGTNTFVYEPIYDGCRMIVGNGDGASVKDLFIARPGLWVNGVAANPIYNEVAESYTTNDVFGDGSLQVSLVTSNNTIYP